MNAAARRDMATSRSQRWRDRRSTFVPDASVIHPAEFGAEVIHCHRQARGFVEKHHYSGSFPASRLSVGLFRKTGLAPSRLVGVAVFSVPMNNASIGRHLGLQPSEGVELGRFVLLDEVAGNGESWLARRAFSLLRQAKPSVVGVLSYSDPLERRSADGVLIKPGHQGQIYDVLGANRLGRGRARYELLTPDGQPFSERAISKIRNGESGRGYAIDELVRRGAPTPIGDDTRAWFDGLVAGGLFTRRRHPGNYVFGFSLTRRARHAARQAPSFLAERSHHEHR